MLKAFGQLALITAAFAVLLAATAGQPRQRALLNPLDVVAYEFGSWVGLFAISAVAAGIVALISKRPYAALGTGCTVATALLVLNLVGRQI